MHESASTFKSAAQAVTGEAIASNRADRIQLNPDSFRMPVVLRPDIDRNWSIQNRNVQNI